MTRAVGSDCQLNAIIRELDAIHRSLFVHFRAQFCRMIQQYLIKITARHLISVIGLRAVAVLEVKLSSVIRARAHDFATVLFYEPGARKFFAFEHDHAPPGTREESRSSAAGRSTSDDRHVVHAATHRFDLSKLLKACPSKSCAAIPPFKTLPVILIVRSLKLRTEVCLAHRARYYSVLRGILLKKSGNV